MKVYDGRRTERGCQVTCHLSAGHEQRSYPLPPRNDLFNHSPDGFEWGYGGSGPAQLALAILADCLGDDDTAVQLHQQFKFGVIARLPRNEGWTLTERQVREYLGLTIQ